VASKKKTSEDTKSPPDGPTFEKSVAEVERIIGRIESGEMGLEEQIEQYARGAEMLERCRTVLERCEQRVEEITVRLEKPDRESEGR
jgi:exodeoxyribonuclease VII small subunit